MLVWHSTYFEGSTQKKNKNKTKKKQKKKQNKTKKKQNKKKNKTKKEKTNCVFCFIFVTHLGLRDLLFPRELSESIVRSFSMDLGNTLGMRFGLLRTRSLDHYLHHHSHLIVT